MIRLLSVVLASASLLLASCASSKKEECSMCSASGSKTADCCSQDKASDCCDAAAPAAKAKHKH